MRASCKTLICLASDIRTKTDVVRLRQRNSAAERDRKRPEVGPQAGPRGSDTLLEMAPFCAFPAGGWDPKKNVPNGCLGGGRGSVVKPSLLLFQWVINDTKFRVYCLENLDTTSAASIRCGGTPVCGLQDRVLWHWLRCMRRRSQRHRLTWRKMMRIAERWRLSSTAAAPLSRMVVRRHDRVGSPVR